MRKMATWAGLGALVLSGFVAAPASAQVTSRSATLSDSAPGASSVSYDIKFTYPSTTAANDVKGVRFQFCSNSPLYNTSCTALGGTFVRGTGITTQTDNGGALSNNYSAATNGTTDVLLTNATGNTFTSGHVYRFVLSGFTNINTDNTQFYVRVVTCNDTTCTVGAGSNLDNGGYAVSTSRVVSVTGTVQESLQFCVAQTITTPCTSISGGATVTLSPNPMTTGGNSNGTAQMAAATNATGGYVITYNGTTFTDTTSDTITAAPSGGATVNSGGTEQFGFTLRAQTSGNLNSLGAEPSGGTGASATAPYNTQNSTIAYNASTGTQVASASGPSAYTTYTMLYAANVAPTTKPGIYTATQTFIATGTF